jgi:hypothetical protein
MVSFIYVFIISSLLFFVHLKNYALGKTTNERFSKKAATSFSEAAGETTTYFE